MRNPLPFAVTFFLSSLCHTAQARLIYVAPGGNNSTDGTISRPLADPRRALQIAAANDTVVLRAGNYALSHPLAIERDGITVTSAPGATASVSAPIAASDGVGQAFEITASRVTLSNLEIRGGSNYSVKVDVNAAKVPSTDVTIRNCRIGGSGRDCVKTFNADRLRIEGCDIGPSGLRDPSNAEGIDSIGSHGVTIRRCAIHDTATNGLYLKGGATDGLIESCRIENTSHFAGLLLGQDTDAEFMRDGTRFEARRCTALNNLILNTGGPGMGTYSGENILFQNNTLYNVARESGAGVWVGVNRRNVPAQNVAFTNNIIVISGERPYAYLLKTGPGLVADNNVYFNSANRGSFRTERDGQVKTLAFAAWKNAVRIDAHSRETNPALDATGNYRPRAIGVASTLGAKIEAIPRRSP